MLAKPDWATARPSTTRASTLARRDRSRPKIWSAQTDAAQRQIAGASASCRTGARRQPPTPADRPVGSVAGDLAGAPMPAATQPRPPIPGLQRLEPAASATRGAGGIALGMTDATLCNAPASRQRRGRRRRQGERKVVLTYLSGTWPGIYTFDDGRLKVIDRAPAAGAGEAAARQKSQEAGEAEDRQARDRAEPIVSTPAGSAVSSAVLAASHSSSALAIAATTLARVFDSSAARAGSRAKKSPSASVVSSFASWRVSCAIAASACEIRLRSGAVSARFSAAARRACTGSAAQVISLRRSFPGFRRQAPGAGSRRDRRRTAHLAALHQPQPVGAGFQQIAVVRHQITAPG